MVNKTRAVFCLLAGLLALAALPTAMAEVDVTIDRNPVQVNESFQLVFSLDHNPDRDPDFSTLQQHFMVLSNNRSSSISIINGEYQRSVKWTLQLMAKQVGEYLIPTIRFGPERSKPFQVTVKPSSLAAVPNDQLVLELLTDRQQSHVQGQIILTLRLLSASSISAYQFGDISILGVDAMVEPMGDERDYQTRIADKSYLVLEKQFAVFPQQSGRLEVSPVLAEVRLVSGSSFDPFQTGGKVRRLRSQPVFIDIDPIPTEYDAPYWLPADRLELREEWHGDLAGLVAGEPITRSLTLVADGLTAAQLPELKLPPIDGVKQYPDQPGLQNSRSSQGISGRREQKIALIPGAAGTFRLPEISLPWWNRQTGKMETATIPARELVVAGAILAVAPQPAAPVAQTPAPMAPAPVPAGNRFWLWLSLLLALGWGLSAIYWWFRSRRTDSASAAGLEHASLRQARRLLQRACDDNDAAAARSALLAWGQALPIAVEINNLRQLGEYFGPELAQQIEALNQSLYAADHQSWQGRDLWSLCQQLEQQSGGARADDELLPLNPAA